MNILITGATGHIGEDLAVGLASTPHRLLCQIHRQGSKTLQLQKRLHAQGAQAFFFPSSLEKTAAIVQLMKKIERKCRTLDVLIHCASVYERMPLQKITEKSWEQALAVDLKAAFFLARTAARIGAKKIIFFSDVATQFPYPEVLPYLVAKGGLETLTRALALELAPATSVNAVALHLYEKSHGVSAAMQKNILRKLPLARMQKKSEVISLVKWLMNEAQTVTGQIISLDSGRGIR